MKLATFNINGINTRLPLLLKWLEDSRPDIVCLQELKTPGLRFPAGALRDAGYEAVWAGQKSWNGVAILSRGATPVLTRERLPGDPGDKQARYIEAAVKGIVVGCLYLPNGNPQPGPTFDYKQAWFARLNRHAKSLLKSGAPVVLAGDYNVVPSDDISDIYSPASWAKDALLQPEPRAAFRRLLAQGWTDALIAKGPKTPTYTFWTYWRNRYAQDKGLRIDHMLVSPSLAPRLKKAGVDRDVRGEQGTSDHAPVWLTLKR
ncbi:Exodeoxyribonuclease III [Alphaproteobacteria bacterium SO-S41]|nr:Exodeoxyribonuclease III [Alphaproteobacteria bacterium SO-S41]